MKKTFISILAALMALTLLCGCSAPASNSNGAAAPSGEFSKADLGVLIAGKTYYLREDASAVLAALGDDFEYSEMVSCVYDGKDKTYKFDGITVNTVPVDGKDLVEMFTLTSDKYSTLRGAKTGDALDAVRACYDGAKEFDDGYLTYSLTADMQDVNAERIQFEYSDDRVNKIYIYSPSY